jgi:hypothetical protein
MGERPGMDAVKKCIIPYPYWKSNPGLPDRSLSLYRLSYPRSSSNFFLILCLFPLVSSFLLHFFTSFAWISVLVYFHYFSLCYLPYIMSLFNLFLIILFSFLSVLSYPPSFTPPAFNLVHLPSVYLMTSPIGPHAVSFLALFSCVKTISFHT